MRESMRFLALTPDHCLTHSSDSGPKMADANVDDAEGDSQPADSLELLNEMELARRVILIDFDLTG